jgi:hypothetical protein
MQSKENFKSLNSKVNKYDLKWQILRVNLKSLDLGSRFILLHSYFNNNKTIENCVRILNYLEGLKISSIFKEEIEEKIFHYKKELSKGLVKNGRINLNFKEYSFNEKFKLFKDLFNRNKKWLLKGYYHREQNSFINSLLSDLEKENDKNLKIIRYKEELEVLQKNCAFIENTYKFIY